MKLVLVKLLYRFLKPYIKFVGTRNDFKLEYSFSMTIFDIKVAEVVFTKEEIVHWM